MNFIFIFRSLPPFHTFRRDTGHHGPSLEHAMGEGTWGTRVVPLCVYSSLEVASHLITLVSHNTEGNEVNR